jgi:hypothetical protein
VSVANVCDWVFLLVFYFEVEVNVLFHVAGAFDVHVDVFGVRAFACFHAGLAGFAGEGAG